jgi:hypothetical protein
MKSLILLFSFFLVSIGSNLAQNRGNHDITFPTAEAIDQDGIVTEFKQAPQVTGRVIGTVGSNFTSKQIMQMPARSINKISALTLGVQENGGGEPIIKGSVGGTAYFVDGVRVRSGSLALAGFSF